MFAPCLTDEMYSEGTLRFLRFRFCFSNEGYCELNTINPFVAKQKTQVELGGTT